MGKLKKTVNYLLDTLVGKCFSVYSRLMAANVA